jgi:hypothetical protein
MQNEPNFNQRAEFTRRSFGGRFARPNKQTVQILQQTFANFSQLFLKK